MGALFHGLVAVGMLAPSVANAGAGDATLAVHNRFDGEVEVQVDGRFEGIARADATTSFEVRPGVREVVISRPGTRYVLESQRIHLSPYVTTSLPVHAPAGTLRVENEGEVPLKVDLGSTELWLQPGSVVSLPVETGELTLQASIHDPRGDWMAIERALWVEPGQAASTTLKPEPTVIVVANRQSVPVRALLDGADAGWIQPGETERVWVRPGPTRVVLVDRAGRVFTTTSLVVTRGEEARVVVAPPMPPVTIIHGDASNRPG